MMPSNLQHLKESPRVQANFVSRILFWWLNDLFRILYRKHLELGDLYKTQPEDESEKLGDRFYAEWENQVQQYLTSGKPTQRKLLRVLIKLFGRRFVAIGLIKFFEECVSKIATPLILGYLIRFFTGEFDKTVGLLCCLGIIAGSTSNIFTMHSYFLMIEHLGMQIRLSCSAALYKKALKIKLSSLGGTVGQMMNLIANDVNRFDSLQHIHYLWIGLTQLTITSYILWTNFGLSFFCGIASLLLFTPIQGFLGGIFSKLRAASAKNTDKRIRLINELLQGIRSIKMQCWEMTFSSAVESVRKDELAVLKKVTSLLSLNWSLYYTSSKVAIFLTLVVYVISGNVLTAEVVFMGVAFYNNIRITMTLHFPLGINQLVDFLLTIKRVQEFLEIEERNNNLLSNECTESSVKRNEDKSARIYMKNVSSTWCSKLKKNVISDLNMDVSSHQLLSVVGPVGSAKTSLLLTLLEELKLTGGTIEIDGKISYASQSPWLFRGSIRDNILLGQPYRPEWYDFVVEACALKRDFELHPEGDMTLIADGTLSGGQQARTSLARAVYRDADIYLLDDVFSAVDVNVQRHIFEKCLQHLLKDKMVILVTHQLQFLQSSDKIFVMEKGKFIARAVSSITQAINPLCKTNTEDTPSTLIHDLNNESQITNSKSQGHIENDQNDLKLLHLVDSNLNNVILTSSNRAEIQNPHLTCGGQDEDESVQEEKLSGCVDLSVYRRYFSSGANILMIIILVVLNIITQSLHTGSDYWLQIWSKLYENGGPGNVTVEPYDDFNNTTITDGDEQRNLNSYFYGLNLNMKTQILIYTSIIVFLFIFSMLRTIMFFEICLSASFKLHNKMLSAVMRAPMKFFDLNPPGRILNRFTKDTKLMDEDLPQTFFETMEIFLNIIGILTIVFIVNPYITIPVIFLAITFYYLRRIYVRSARSVQRLEAITRSPVYSHISATLNNGLPTIRAFQAEHNFYKKFCEYQDVHSSTWFLTIAMTRWIGVWLDFISVTFIAIVVLTLTMTAQVSGAAAGMAISSAMFLTGVFQWGVRQSATVENQMVSIERILDYTTLTSEAFVLSSADNEQPDGWPFDGKIDFVDLNLQYNNDSPTLKNINVQIKSKEKIGIIGRTGAGKSSLITALFRLTEPCSGRIEVDGVNILQIGLQDLRRSISIIPQDPFLFQGTLRRNLSTTNEYSDDDLWTALRDVGLSETIKQSPFGLNVQINEGGTNFSIGERQLFCLARAILRKSKILILDEASASIDERTDKLVQKTIREKFKDCTVLTIAHRLSTIMDSDRILVMDEGMVKEFDVPHILLQNRFGFLSKMVEQIGDESHHLRIIAKQTYLQQSLNADISENHESCA